ncbi:MAG TPA: acetoin dehydrogenase dihydrolipoyllysine-residue acetyltransferase subunit [Ktedonobacteraceae bacterium]|nr:acetoin dehydrogenase dihydrolipoyllysine-residue acetyltransferase subunit [Ktedonobacteraceae bacterium]
MATIFSMPKWGLAMKSGQVVEWLKQRGDTIRQGEPLAVIESEKATNEVESPVAGTLRWLEVQEGQDAAVGAALAVITEPGEELSDEQVSAFIREDAEVKRQKAEALAGKKSTTAPSASASRTSVRAPASSGGRINASPAARRLAQELGVDLATISGTGPGAMIGREDVLRAAEEAKAAPTEDVEEKDVDVDGILTHCLIAGPANAPHVVFVHGLGGSLTTWSLNLTAFAGQFRICALDLVGAGSSAKPTMDYSVPALSAFLARFLDTLGPDWQHVSIIGHSLGGAIALAFAASHPQRVERLVLVDSAGLGPEIDPTVLELMRSTPTSENLRAELTHFFAQPGMVQQALVDQLYQQRMQPGAHDALVATSDAAFGNGQQRIDLRDKLTELSIPVLVIWGDADAVLPVAHAQEGKRAAQGRIEVFAGSGHCPHIEHADAFNQLVRAFLEWLS